ncbi:DUF4381 family protein [Stenotrophomonas sp. CD2]|nr:DUF4381 family protein [Stenotrophomonas sp. CD2]
MSASLPLRDVQLPPAPSWWPPAPGYLMIAGAVLLVLLVVAFFGWQRRRRRQRWLQLFDRELASTADAAAELAAIAGLLRRAARQARPAVNPCAMMPGGGGWIRRARCPMPAAACWPKGPTVHALTPAKWPPCAVGRVSAIWPCCWSAVDEPAGELLAVAGPAAGVAAGAAGVAVAVADALVETSCRSGRCAARAICGHRTGSVGRWWTR